MCSRVIAIPLTGCLSAHNVYTQELLTPDPLSADSRRPRYASAVPIRLHYCSCTDACWQLPHRGRYSYHQRQTAKVTRKVVHMHKRASISSVAQ